MFPFGISVHADYSKRGVKAKFMPVNINITKKEYAYIDGESGNELTPEQFNQKYSTINVGGLGTILSRGKLEEAEGENNKE